MPGRDITLEPGITPAGPPETLPEKELEVVSLLGPSFALLENGK